MVGNRTLRRVGKDMTIDIDPPPGWVECRTPNHEFAVFQTSVNELSAYLRDVNRFRVVDVIIEERPDNPGEAIWREKNGEDVIDVTVPQNDTKDMLDQVAASWVRWANNQS